MEYLEYRMETDDANKSKMPGAGHAPAKHPKCCHRAQVAYPMPTASVPCFV